jgi:uncharacterized protein
MPNVVIDASVVVSAALMRGSVPERAIRLARAVDVICISDAVVEEHRAVLARPKFQAAITPERAEELVELLLADSRRYRPRRRVRDCRDEKDNRYLELAEACGAAFLITGDGDLLSLDPWRGVRIVRPAEYVALNSERARPGVLA